jgi:hypothetical protein
MTRAEKMIAFIETLRTPDGAGVGQPFVLRCWQKAIIREAYDAEDGERRYGMSGRELAQFGADRDLVQLSVRSQKGLWNCTAGWLSLV